VPDTNKEDGKLDGDGRLWDVGPVVKDLMVLDEFHKAIKNMW
jgi:hypothetical protein